MCLQDAVKDDGKQQKVMMIDPSLVFRPEDAIKQSGGWEFRKFEEDHSGGDDNPWLETVKRTYMNMHSFQCVEYVKRKVRKKESNLMQKTRVSYKEK